MAQQFYATPTLAFSGTGANGELTPNAFISEMESRRIPHNLDETQLIAHTRMALKGPARTWYDGTIEDETPDVVERFKTDWAFFKQRFQDNYRMGKQTTKFLWAQIINQSSKESASHWLNEARLLLSRHHKQHNELTYRKFARPLQGNAVFKGIANMPDLFVDAPGTDQATKDAVNNAFRLALDHYRVTAEANFENNLQDNWLLFRIAQRREMLTLLMPHFAKSDKTKEKLLDWVDKHPDADLSAFLAFSTTLPDTPQQQGRGVGEVSKESADVNEAARRRQQEDQKKKNNKKGGQKNDKKPVKKDIVCKYCDKRGHVKKDCFKRKRDIAAIELTDDEDEGTSTRSGHEWETKASGNAD